MSMADFDLRKLEYFLAVADGMNISQAAKKLGVTQPALSRQIRAFEESLGWELLERGKKSIKLTRAGESVIGVFARPPGRIGWAAVTDTATIAKQPPAIVWRILCLVLDTPIPSSWLIPCSL